MRDEIEVSYKNGTWELEEKLEKKKIVGCKWVCKIKQGISRVEAKRSEAMLAAKGFTQRECIDFIEVFSPVVRHASIRIILSFLAINDMHLE